jgi:hypothetical protein
MKYLKYVEEFPTSEPTEYIELLNNSSNTILISNYLSILIIFLLIFFNY